MLTGVTITCFLFSYLAVWILEVSRIFCWFRARHAIVIIGMLAGMLAHSIFLGNEFFSDSSSRVLGNWFQWVVLGAWGLALACTVLTIRNPGGSVGLFLLPMVLALIGLAALVRGSQPFTTKETIDLLGWVHGVSLLLGTMFICLGFAFGIMYLMQSYRLKSKKKTSGLLRLPALEFLRSMNRLNIFISALALGVGMLSGILLNFNQEGHIAWFSSGVVVSVALFLWAAIAAGLEYCSKSSLGGRRSAYLSIANFVFLAIVLLLVLWASHGQATAQSNWQEQGLVGSHCSATREGG